MAGARVRRAKPQLQLGPLAAGTLLTANEFDAAEFEEGWRYELIHDVLVVSPIEPAPIRDANEELGYWLRKYQERHSHGSHLDYTIYGQTVSTRRSRRHAHRATWIGLGRLPKRSDAPTVVTEFVTCAGRAGRQRDTKEKRDEYFEVGVCEYWIIDSIQRRSMTVYCNHGDKVTKRVVREQHTYTTSLLPGFELPLARLFSFIDRWPAEWWEPDY
jgi:Uma2 family endonuclease